MENFNWFKVAVSSAAAAIGAYLGILGYALIVLLVLMILDYITGIMKSASVGKLSSAKGFKGILKKIVYPIVIVTALLFDYIILLFGAQFNVALPIQTFFGTLMTLWFIINESISILENAIKLDVKLPGFFKSFLEKMAKKIADTGDEILNKKD